MDRHNLELATHFDEVDHIHVPGFLGVAACRQILDSIEDDSFDPLPTDGGGVYEIYTGDLPKALQELGDSLAQSIGHAAGYALREQCSEIEVLRYNNMQSLSMHRDTEGLARTKSILTLNGRCDFTVESTELRLETGDLVVLRGIEFKDTPTPLHATRNNQERIIALIEPLYSD